jgi:hypothetical protein
MSYVLSVLDFIEKDQYMFGTMGDRPKSPDIKSRINGFVNGKGQQAVHSAASKVLGTVKEHHKSVLASAVITGITHAAHIDIAPGDVETHLHHQIEHLGTSLSISKTLAHAALTHAVGKLKELRGIKEDKDEELDRAIVRLHKILKLIEPHYNPKPKPKPEK